MSTLGIILIYLYRATNFLKVSVLMSVFGYVSVCKHQPSCSEYMVKQLRAHGTIWGFWKGLWRILTCW